RDMAKIRSGPARRVPDGPVQSSLAVATPAPAPAGPGRSLQPRHQFGDRGTMTLAVLGAVLGAGRVLRLLRLLNRRRPHDLRGIRETLRMPILPRRLGRVRVTSGAGGGDIARLRGGGTSRLPDRLRPGDSSRLRDLLRGLLRDRPRGGSAGNIRWGTSRLGDRLVGDGTVGAHRTGARGRPPS